MRKVASGTLVARPCRDCFVTVFVAIDEDGRKVVLDAEPGPSGAVVVESMRTLIDREGRVIGGSAWYPVCRPSEPNEICYRIHRCSEPEERDA